MKIFLHRPEKDGSWVLSAGVRVVTSGAGGLRYMLLGDLFLLNELSTSHNVRSANVHISSEHPSRCLEEAKSHE